MDIVFFFWWKGGIGWCCFERVIYWRFFSEGEWSIYLRVSLEV